MNENAFSVGRVKYKAVPAEDGCDGCVFDKTACPAGIGLFPSCNAKRRQDGADVIFIEDIQTNADRIRAMSSPEQCKGCYREQRCDLWRNKTLRQQIEAEGCDYFQDHAITNFELFSSEIEALANAMIFESMPNVWRFRLGEKVSVQAFSSTDEAKQAAVEYLQQAVDPM